MSDNKILVPPVSCTPEMFEFVHSLRKRSNHRIYARIMRDMISEAHQEKLFPAVDLQRGECESKLPGFYVAPEDYPYLSEGAARHDTTRSQFIRAIIHHKMTRAGGAQTANE